MKELGKMVNAYCRLRDRQYAVYAACAKKHDLTVNELFVLDILWFAPEGCTQKDICKRLSANKQTIAAIAGRFLKKGYIALEEVKEDRRNKLIRFTECGRAYAGSVIPPAAAAENAAMERLGPDKIAELVRLTESFTENMEREFSKVCKNASARSEN
ncbi:MAG: MarR family winged helix-turn-helix transcriptional regulator [Eubacteriales bacterium]